MRDKQKQKDWRKINLHSQVGLRPTEPIEVMAEAGYKIKLYENDFLFRKKGEKTYRIFGREPLRAHIPRSLCRRVRVTLNSEDVIIGETDKCFV
jgi:hypothetical protein